MSRIAWCQDSPKSSSIMARSGVGAEGVKRSAELEVLSWPAEAPMYLKAKPDLGAASTATARFIPQYEVMLRLAAKEKACLLQVGACAAESAPVRSEASAAGQLDRTRFLEKHSVGRRGRQCPEVQGQRSLALRCGSRSRRFAPR